VLEGASGHALAFGPGHLQHTADAGERGITVYAAHRDTHFRFLKEVAMGDVIDVTRSDGRHFRYRADSSAVVRFDASGIDTTAQGFELVLATCWPFDAVTSGPERYILHATLIEATERSPIGLTRAGAQFIPLHGIPATQLPKDSP
jgi:sortase A